MVEIVDLLDFDENSFRILTFNSIYTVYISNNILYTVLEVYII